MGEPRSITYNEVKKSVGEGPQSSTELWHKVGDIVGAGHVGLDSDGNASIDLTEVSEAKRTQIDNLLARKEEAKDEEVANTTKRGNK